MSNPSPLTHKEAIAKGGRPLKDADVKQIPVHHLNSARALVASDNSPGSYCNETACIGGKKYVIYRDETGGCTKYVEMDC